MKKIIIKWIIFALVIMGTCYLPGVKVDNFAFAMLVAAILTAINVFIKPIIKFIAIPINIFSFGLFNFIINLGILYLVSFIIPQYNLNNFFSAFLSSIIIAVSYCLIKNI